MLQPAWWFLATKLEYHQEAVIKPSLQVGGSVFQVEQYRKGGGTWRQRQHLPPTARGRNSGYATKAANGDDGQVLEEAVWIYPWQGDVRALPQGQNRWRGTGGGFQGS